MSNQLKASHIQRFILTAANIRSNQVFIPDLPTLQVLMCESAYFLGWWIIRLQLKVLYVCLRLPPVQMFDSFGTLLRPINLSNFLRFSTRPFHARLPFSLPSRCQYYWTTNHIRWFVSVFGSSWYLSDIYRISDYCEAARFLQEE